jgi:PadR family transcriptional regulator, regulatory protein AphA
MNTQEITHNGVTILEVLPDEARLSTEQDALDLVGECGGLGTNRLLIHAGALNDDFYDLRTGLAGAAMLKWTNYRIITAAVIPPEIASQGRFGEMALEANRRRNSDFKVFTTREEALDWLAQGE